MPFDAELVRRVTVAYRDTLLTLTREGTDSLKSATWTISGNKPDQPAAPARADQARMLAVGIAGMTADGFPASTDTIPASWEPLPLRLEVEAAGGDRATIEFGPKNPTDQHYVRRAGNPAVYLMGSWRLNRFRKTYAELVEGGTPSMPPSKPAGPPGRPAPTRPR